MARTVGVEEEFLLVRPRSAALAAAGDEVVAAAGARSSGQFEHELKREQAELATSPHDSLQALGEELRRRRTELDEGARRHRLRLAALGTSPIDDQVSATHEGRYERMLEAFGRIARLQLTCGMHVHVSVESPDEGVLVLDRLRPWLAVILALSTNSPFYSGEDTDYASFRTQLWGQWPTAGATEPFRDPAGYEAARLALIQSGAALDDGMLYFDARLSARYPTVEIRVADVCPYAEDAVTIAGLCRALVATAAQAGTEQSAPRTDLLRAATWRAARWGTTTDLLDPGTGERTDAWKVVDRLVAWVRPALEEADDADAIQDGLAAIRGRGTGATLQREVFAATGDLADVVDVVATRTVGG